MHRLCWKDLEDKIRLEFKRQAYQYISRVPSTEFEWLALMQHYGSPTRLLDFTKSVWAALFFAVDGSMSDSALWAIDITHSESDYNIKKTRKAIKSDYSEELELKIEQILKTNDEPETPDEWYEYDVKVTENNPDGFDLGIIFAEPLYQNNRLAIQQGTFAFPKEICFSFEMNMSKKFGCNSLEELSKKNGNIAIYKYKLPKEIHLDIISMLYRMNISAATLFPGLEGFARSQVNHVRLYEYKNAILMKSIDEYFKKEENINKINILRKI